MLMINLLQHKKTGSGRRLAALLLAFLLTACVLSAATLPVARTAQAFGVITEPAGVASSTVTDSSSDRNEATARTVAAADPSDRNEATASELLDGIFEYLKASFGAGDLQGVIDDGFAANDEYVSGEWYIFALSQYGSFDLSPYHKTLHHVLDRMNRIVSGVELEKYTLLDMAMGYDVSRFQPDDLAGSVGTQGIMSYVFGLHLLNNGLEIHDCTAEETVRALLSMQLEDGGWAISGSYSDVDVTSMTLQSLVPYVTREALSGSPAADASSDSTPANTSAGAIYPYAPTISDALRADVTAAADRAIALLASRQNDNAGFSSYGAENVESSAQVLVALSALGIDVCSDPRFVRNSRTVLDAIADYRLADGSFAHVAGGESNANATQQVCYACVAYLRFRGGQPPLYDLDAVRRSHGSVTPVPTPGEVTVSPEPTGSAGQPTPTDDPGNDVSATPTPAGGNNTTPGGDITPTPAGNNTTPSATEAPGTSPSSGKSGTKIPPYRLWGSGILAVLAILGFTVLALRKRLTRRNALLLAGVLAALTAILWLVRIQTPDQYYASLAVSDEEAAGSVTLSIRCDTVSGIDGLPEDGVMLAPVKIAFREGDTVFDALSAAAAKAKLPLDISGGGNTYIRSIGTLREFSYGTLSGWMYYVNGEAPTESCGQRKLRDGDVIEWRYTRDMGSDTEN